MRYSFLIVLLCLSCNNAVHEQTGTSPSEDSAKTRTDTTAHSTNTFHQTQVGAKDILYLNNPTLQSSFFSQLDSMLNIQYQNHDQEKDIFVDLTPKMLEQFLRDLDTNQLIKTGAFEISYHFNIAPPKYKDTKACSDQITIEYDSKSKFFILTIGNRFYYEWCQESSVRYTFTITQKGIRLIDRTEAG